MSVVITNIQRMCFQDGPGIRTTVFLKGCGIHCPWCANPENISFQVEEAFGRVYEVDELLTLLRKDKPFWGEDGGVTFSGGEPLLQAVDLEELWRQLKAEGIFMAMETSLFAPIEYLKKALEYIDFFYVDIKLLEPDTCGKVLGGSIETYLENLAFLAESGKEIHFRIPCSEEYVLQKDNMEKIYALLKTYAQYPVEIFAVHNLGDSKYRKLGKEPLGFQTVSGEWLQEVKAELEKLSVEVEIIRL